MRRLVMRGFDAVPPIVSGRIHTRPSAFPNYPFRLTMCVVPGVVWVLRGVGGVQHPVGGEGCDAWGAWYGEGGKGGIRILYGTGVGGGVRRDIVRDSKSLRRAFWVWRDFPASKTKWPTGHIERGAFDLHLLNDGRGAVKLAIRDENYARRCDG